tara:strand:+ start:2311 stop:3114 length:804 start_codon:yes stop_codon:yes gene_type:complete
MEIDEIKLESWKCFLDHIKGLDANNNFIFRGQANKEWGLETTLERFLKKELIEYHEYEFSLLSIKETIRTLYPNLSDLKTSDIHELKDFFKSRIPTINNKETDSRLDLGTKGIEFLAYIRHFGFPSPLLDWTQSPFIAAYFAFREETSSDPAIYIFSESPWSGSTDPKKTNYRITGLGHHIMVDKRHISQQCEYTYCIGWDPSENLFFANHNYCKATDFNSFYRVTLPQGERESVLRFLEQVNINAYTLFHSEDSLMEQLAIKYLRK